MTNVTIKSLAAEIQIPVDRLVEKFSDAGINKTAEDMVTKQEKKIFLEYLNSNSNIVKHINTRIFQRKTRSTLHVSSVGGKSKSVQIEIRRKSIYVQDENYIKPIETTEVTPKTTTTSSSIEKNKFSIENEKKSDLFKIEKQKNVSNKNYNKQKISHIIGNNIKTQSYSNDTIEYLKNKVEDEISIKVEKETKKNVSEVLRRISEDSEKFEKNIKSLYEDDSNDYHITTSYHAREAEDEHDRNVENKRRFRSRIDRTIKHKKSEKSVKYDREEARIVARGSNKSKRQVSTLKQEFNKPLQIINRDVIIGETITIAELANKMAVKGSQVIKMMMKLGAMVTINQVIDQETAQLVAEEMGHKVILRRENYLEELVINNRNTGNIATLKQRAPIVTIMGHVDHGKTSLLDYIRSTKVKDEETGGITQHMGAYHVNTNRGMITFLDTPGHMAFTAMRSRGVQVTDIIVLVIAVDDGVMPQTIEAIQHAQSAKVPIIVAINKIDKTGMDTNIENIKHHLTKYGIIPDSWGGDNQFINISAKYGIGIDDLIDAIILQAEILELKCISSGMATGIVIESFLDKGRGPVITILVREGILNSGDVLLCGCEYGRIRAMYDDVGRNIHLAGPSIPVKIIGLSGLPDAGETATVVCEEKKAREVALYRQGKFRDIKLSKQKKVKLETIFSNMKNENKFEFNIVLKSDCHGSSEAIKNALENLSTDNLNINIIGSGIGGITETDVILSAASNAILLSFNVRADASARRLIELENIDFRYYSVIYHLIEDIKNVISRMLLPESKKEIIGVAEIRTIFRSQKCGIIAGCMVTNGIVKRYNKIRILRKNIEIYEGELESLRRFKDDVNEVRNGMECGIGLNTFNDVCVGDTIEVFKIVCKD